MNIDLKSNYLSLKKVPSLYFSKAIYPKSYLIDFSLFWSVSTLDLGLCFLAARSLLENAYFFLIFLFKNV